jgi:DNA helicase-2/ATP-dependent DNA helicase PcrA
VADEIKNCFLVNAPAGSGKTTQIKAMIRNFVFESPKDNILCITYTNRAADELSKDITAKNVFIGTIHAFLFSFMKPYFNHENIIALYLKTYRSAIERRITNANEDEYITQSNEKYIQRYGELSYDAIARNITAISYNESPFSSLYYGGLSHDDLIRFSKNIFDTYPAITRKITAKYQCIFFDEYQDTTADVLKIFFNSVSTSNTCKLYLFGDRMQQIYKNYNGSFEEQFALFDTSEALRVNYRSVKEIVDILNLIYNNESFIQQSDIRKANMHCDFTPRVIICNGKADVEKRLAEIKVDYPDTLVLYLLNKERFSDIGAESLYQVFSSMDKYSYEKKYNAVDVLIAEYQDNPDPLMQLLYLVIDMYDDFTNARYGLIIQKAKNYKTIFNQSGWQIFSHEDKLVLFEKLQKIFSVIRSPEKSVGDLIAELSALELVRQVYTEQLMGDEDYSSVFDVPIIEAVLVYNYMKEPKISTQHGLKGESHDSVVFVADDSNSNPVVHMYDFFEIWAMQALSLRELQQLYYSYSESLYSLQQSIGCKINDLKKETYTTVEPLLIEKAKQLCHIYEGNPIFSFFCAKKYQDFLSKPGVTKAKNAFKENTIYGVFSAYKLFYVGCSRARRNLTILVDRTKIKENIELQVKKFKQLGFDVIEK